MMDKTLFSSLAAGTLGASRAAAETEAEKPPVSVRRHRTLGRTGFRRFGVSTAGAMDRHALARANALVVVPEPAARLDAGTEVDCLLLERRRG